MLKKIGFFPKLCRDVLGVLSVAEKQKALVLVACFLLTAISEILAIGAIYILFKVIFLESPSGADAQITALMQWVGASTPRDFLKMVAIATFMLVCIKTVMGVASTWVSMRYACGRLAAFSSDLYGYYLHRPYLEFVAQHTANLKQRVLDEVYQAVFNILLPICGVLAEFMYLVIICGMLLLVQPQATLAIFGCCVVTFGVYSLLTRRIITRAGDVRERENSRRHHLVNEGFSLHKELVIFDAQGRFVQAFLQSVTTFARAFGVQYSLFQVPRYLIEWLAFMILFGFLAYFIGRADAPQDSMAMLALYGAAGLRLMPSFNRIAVHLSNMRYSQTAFYAIAPDLTLARGAKHAPDANVFVAPFGEAIELQQVGFYYQNSEEASLADINMTIRKGARVALVGPSGAGKTTLGYLLLGLAMPTSGNMLVDGVVLTPEHLKAWRTQVGYVPQRTVLMDASVKENIALGVPPEAIDMAQVKAACRAAHIDTYIENELPGGYEARLGEHGVRLSGGQAQRLAIARALYRKPRLLILDEATAALDQATEQSIAQTLQDLGPEMTVISIAHRLSTIQGADTIYMLENGGLNAAGAYAELMQNLPEFRTLLGSMAEG